MRPRALSEAQTPSHGLLVPGQGQAEVEVSSSPAHLELPAVALEMIREMAGPPRPVSPQGLQAPGFPWDPRPPPKFTYCRAADGLKCPGPAWPQQAPSSCGIAGGCSCWRHPGALPTHTLRVRPVSSPVLLRGAWGDRQ